MNVPPRRFLVVCASWLLLLPALLNATPLAAADRSFEIRFAHGAHDKPFSGRVYLFFSREREEPRRGPDWFHPEQFIARDVDDWIPGETLTFSTANAAGMLAYPVPLAEMPLDGYRAQAVVRFNPHERRIGTGPGNGYSAVSTLSTDSDGELREEFVVDELVEEQPFPETAWCRLLSVRSKLLSEFHQRDVFLEAAVLLPEHYADEDRRFPTIFTIPGFGGTHFNSRTSGPIEENNPGGVEFLRVVLDPSCPLGHHVFADSANNGPVGRALIEEFLPAYDRQFRSVADPRARFLTGHSSGGWSSLWLQVNYPDAFGGTWSTAPDPVDFRDFQRINLYAPGENMYVDRGGNPRPLARDEDQVLLTYRGFADMEWVLGPGGQLHSFEAVFSPRGPDGRPLLLWNRATGAIDPNVVRAWQRYDIRLLLERNWSTLGPKLAGKLHVFMGEIDTFYLDGATMLLKESLERLGSDAVVEIHPGKDHRTLASSELLLRIRGEMAQRFLKSFDAEPAPR